MRRLISALGGGAAAGGAGAAAGRSLRNTLNRDARGHSKRATMMRSARFDNPQKQRFRRERPAAAPAPPAAAIPLSVDPMHSTRRR